MSPLSDESVLNKWYYSVLVFLKRFIKTWSRITIALPSFSEISDQVLPLQKLLKCCDTRFPVPLGPIRFKNDGRYILYHIINYRTMYVS